jgi:hypothetical protein
VRRPIFQIFSVIFLLLAGLPALAQEHYTLRLTLVQLAGSTWTREAILDVNGQAVRILAQCQVVAAEPELLSVDAEPRLRVFHTPAARELARRLKPGKPAVFFVDATRQRPAFDAEAIGRGNSRTRPELADTVWIVRDARDPGVALAHELAHVLMDSGEHSEEPGNLMREETAPASTRLTEAQCARLRDTAAANGLLRPAAR